MLLTGMYGVVRVTAMPGDAADLIVNSALQQITGLSTRVFQPVTGVCRVLFFYRIFGGNPLVIINVKERTV